MNVVLSSFYEKSKMNIIYNDDINTASSYITFLEWKYDKILNNIISDIVDIPIFGEYQYYYCYRKILLDEYFTENLIQNH